MPRGNTIKISLNIDSEIYEQYKSIVHQNRSNTTLDINAYMREVVERGTNLPQPEIGKNNKA